MRFTEALVNLFCTDSRHGLQLHYLPVLPLHPLKNRVCNPLHGFTQTIHTKDDIAGGYVAKLLPVIQQGLDGVPGQVQGLGNGGEGAP
jgi:hypothetical protein